jgi:hypothetical protein
LRTTFQQIPSGSLLSTKIRKWPSKREGNIDRAVADKLIISGSALA